MKKTGDLGFGFSSEEDQNGFIQGLARAVGARRCEDTSKNIDLSAGQADAVE
jgi:hypothetical protein